MPWAWIGLSGEGDRRGWVTGEPLDYRGDAYGSNATVNGWTRMAPEQGWEVDHRHLPVSAEHPFLIEWED